MTRCFSCKALVPAGEGPTHEYILSSPGCWQVYGEILTKHYTPGNYDPDLHRITVDAYAVQHPGKPERRSIQSVNIHLISLFAIFENDARSGEANSLIRRALDDDMFIGRLQWLEPPLFDGTLTVAEVVSSFDSETLGRQVRDWGASVWKVWREKHFAVIASLIAQLVEAPNHAENEAGRFRI